MQSRTIRIDKDKMDFYPIELDRIDADDWLWEDSEFELDENKGEGENLKDESFE
jgi:hypothetical protein